MEQRDHKDLVNLFKRLGAIDPESWAISELQEGIPQSPDSCSCARLGAA